MSFNLLTDPLPDSVEINGTDYLINPDHRTIIRILPVSYTHLINTIKAQRDTYKTQLDTTKAELKKFDGVNVEDLRGQITKLQTDLSTKENEIAEKLSEDVYKRQF